MASTIPTQERVVDPFASYNSNVVNKITQAITKDENGFLTTNSLQVSLDLLSPLDTVVVSTGYLIKDDVLVNITVNHTVDFTDPDQYYSSTILPIIGYNYIVIDYAYAKSRPAPQASIKILKPSERTALTTNSNLMLLKVVELDVSGDIVALYDADPSIPQNKREYIKYYAGSEVVLPTFEQAGDQSRIAYEVARDKYFFGYSNGWRELAAGGISTDVNTDSTGVVVGSLCYVDSDRNAIPAIATAVDTGADIVVLSVGTAVSGEGRGSVAGFVEDVPVQAGLGIFIGDLLYLSDTHPGTVTNVRTSPYYQVVGRALSDGSVTTPIDMIFSPKITLSMSVEGRITNWAPEGGGLYSRQIDVSGLDGTNAFDCHWFDATTHFEITPYGVEILQNGDRIKVWVSTDAVYVDYIISAGGGAGAGGAGGAGGVTDHALLTGLHYNVSGHIGFAKDVLAGGHGNADHTATYIIISDVTYEALLANGDVGIGATQVARGNHTHAIYALSPHGNEEHSATFIEATGVTYEALLANGDVGTGATQVAKGNHTHTGYAVASATLGNIPEAWYNTEVEYHSANKTTPTTRSEFTVGRPGSYRITWQQISTGSWVSYCRVYRNGSGVGSTQSRGWSGSCTGWANKSVDISGWSTGDSLQIRVWISSMTGTAYCPDYKKIVRNVVVKTGNALSTTLNTSYATTG